MITRIVSALPAMGRILVGRTPATLLLLGAVLLSAMACSVPRGGNSPVSDISGCATVLPLARDAVHGRGTLVLVKNLGPREEGELYRELGGPPQPTPPPGAPPPPPDDSKLPKTCIIGYDGDYPPGSVDDVDDTATGRYALIVLRVRKPTIYRVMLVNQLPDAIPN